MIPRFKPSLDWSEFLTIFKRNNRAVEKFEKEFAKTFNAVDAVAFPYGRSAQWAFLKAIGIENGEVIMPAYTCSVVAHAVTLSGNIPRFIDIDLYDYNMNLDQAELAINENTRAIIPTHTFGYPQDLDRLEAMVEKAEKRYGNKIWLIQDCCHAFGADWKGKMIGTSGDVAIYALNISKHITSIFGGMLTFQDQKLANKIRDWRDGHFKSAGWLKSIKRRLYFLAVYFAFHEKIYGFTLWLQQNTPLLNKLTKAYHLDNKIHFPPDYLDKMLNVEAAVGLKQLKKYPKIIQFRRQKARYYNQNLPRKEGWFFPPIIEGATYSHYTVRVPNRNEVIFDYKNKGIELGKVIQYKIPDLEEYSSSNNNFSHSDEASKNSINFTVS
tara:strand:- start:205 stop:1350 length:1146 start_codon:yes stop_codon:yes gene_type:complete